MTVASLSCALVMVACTSCLFSPHVIRGTPLDAFACPTGPVVPAVPPVTRPPAAVTALLLCRLTGLVGGRWKSVPTLIRPGPELTVLVQDLARPNDNGFPGGDLCPAYANVELPVVARTRSGDVLVTLPVDHCHHYLEGPREAILKAMTPTA
jgi:hypothetical protein